MQKNELFDFMIKRVNETSNEAGLQKPQAFVKWFANLYYPNNQNFFVSDGSRDGKVDSFFNTNDGKRIEHYILNSKFTEEYNKTSPGKFYEEISYLYTIFSNKENRPDYLQKAVKPELRSRYKKLFESFDEGDGYLIFITNLKKNDAQYSILKKLPVKVFHLDEILQFMVDDIDNAMPRTRDLNLYDIHSVLSPDRNDTEVSTSIVFARLIDFIKYMEKDPSDLLFARNIRLNLGNTVVNKGIKETFKSNPKEFAFSNNGITILCEEHTHNPGKKELEIINPRVVNGSQTLHSVRDVPNPSPNARIMLRIIEIPAFSHSDLPSQRKQKKKIIDKISLRSNQQNPIKLWNLVANDDYQLELFRYFRSKNLYYERREKEYVQRSRELKSIRINRGPSLKSMTQIIACFHWKNKKLGPTLARNLSKLFDTSIYDIIIDTKPELVYQLYLLNEIVINYFNSLAHAKKKYQKLRGYINQSLLSLICRVLEESRVRLGDNKVTLALERHNSENKDFIKLVTLAAKFIEGEYIRVSTQYRKKEGIALTIANFFKSTVYVSNLMDRRISFSYAQLCKSLFSQGNS
jgi:hypothetical protein